MIFYGKRKKSSHAIGFLPKKEQNHLAQLEKNPTSLLVEGTNKLIDSLVYLRELDSPAERESQNGDSWP